MPKLADKNRCTGCGACASACPTGCLAMAADAEGFLYPKPQPSCTECGRCQTACPVLHPSAEKPFEQAGAITQHLDTGIRAASTSGGAFSAIAQHVIRQGGVVFGAAFDESLNVVHTAAETEAALAKFRGSKYVQSDTGTTFGAVRRLLKAGRPVCYSGTPCQIEGLLAYLGGEQENLITVDLVCHAIASPLLLKKHIQHWETASGQKVAAVAFRDKSLYGYSYSQFTLRNASGELLYHNGTERDPFMRAFFSDIADRPCCYACAFKKRYRKTDFTLWDCFEPEDYSREMDDGSGASKMLIHTEKGQQVFAAIQGAVRCTPADPDALAASSHEMTHSVSLPAGRQAFMQALQIEPIETVYAKYFPLTLRVRAESTLRKAAMRLGVYKWVRRTYRSLTKKQ